MKKYLAALLISLMPMPAIAASGSMDDAYFSTSNPKLTRQEKTAIDIAESWKASSQTAIRPVAGPDGSIQFPYGISQVSVVCAVLQVCDIELEPGEQVNNINVGDNRWNVEPAITGYGEREVQHLVVKPLDVGLDTSMMVTTNRRTYHFRLRSHRTKFMPHVTFVYPDQATKKWETLRGREEDRQGKTLDTGEYLHDLDFHYKIEGASSWKPVRVYNDGVKTIIQMPSAMSQTEAPTLLVLRGKDSVLPWGRDAEEIMVNYRVQGDRYIVDTIFDKAILVAGVGSRQDRVTISREGKQ